MIIFLYSFLDREHFFFPEFSSKREKQNVIFFQKIIPYFCKKKLIIAPKLLREKMFIILDFRHPHIFSTHYFLVNSLYQEFFFYESLDGHFYSIF